MKPPSDRGRLLFLVSAAAVMLERLAIAGVVLAGPQFSWTNFLMPVTHVAVVVFLIYTADTLIYWLVLLWGVVTAGTFLSNLWSTYHKLTPHDQGHFWEIGQTWIILGLAAFHILTVLVLLSPPVRRYLANRRQALDQFEDTPPVETTGHPAGK